MAVSFYCAVGCWDSAREFEVWDRLRCNQFGDADQVIGDQIEQEVGGDATDAAMSGVSTLISWKRLKTRAMKQLDARGSVAERR